MILNDQKAVQCDSCEMWIHNEYSYISHCEYETLENTNCTWICPNCEVHNFSDSYFDTHQYNIEYYIQTTYKACMSGTLGNDYKQELCPLCRPRWLSWMRHPTGDQEVAGSTPAEVGLSWRLIMTYFLRSFSPFR